jgi:hypothetical protein
MPGVSELLLNLKTHLRCEIIPVEHLRSLVAWILERNGSSNIEFGIARVRSAVLERQLQSFPVSNDHKIILRFRDEVLDLRTLPASTFTGLNGLSTSEIVSRLVPESFEPQPILVSEEWLADVSSRARLCVFLDSSEPASAGPNLDLYPFGAASALHQNPVSNADCLSLPLRYHSLCHTLLAELIKDAWLLRLQ